MVEGMGGRLGNDVTIILVKDDPQWANKSTVVPVGCCVGTRSLRNLRENTKNIFLNIGVCGITHIYSETMLRQLTPPINVMANSTNNAFRHYLE